MILVFKSTQIGGYNEECKRFGRGSLGANPRLVGGEVSSSSKRKKTVAREELPVLLSEWLFSWCRARVVLRTK
jgi:hypothetical protein